MKLLFVLTLFWSNNVFAYLDPGTGSIILQSAIAAIAAGIYTIKIYWFSIKSYISSKFSKSNND